MARLRRSVVDSPGLTRRRRGKGFGYLDAAGRPAAAPDVARIRGLVIPPAWQDVWISPHANGHIQAVGSDEAGRPQYLYHPQWRQEKDREKHERMLAFARRLPAARERVIEDLALPGLPQRKALATAFRLLDLGFFRIGGETYAAQNGSFGLATMRKDHVTIDGEQVVFEYVAKSGKDRIIAIVDDAVLDVVGTLRRRRAGGPELLAWKSGGSWHDVASDDINLYVKDVVGTEVSAKDFRTWHATVLAAVALAVSTHAESPTARKRAVTRAVCEVSGYLGNTPTVCRTSYIDPRVIELYERGTTIERSLRRLGEGASFGHPATHGAVEDAVLRMLSRA